MLNDEMQKELDWLKIIGQFKAVLSGHVVSSTTEDELLHSVEGVFREEFPERRAALYLFERDHTNVVRVEYTVQGESGTTRAVEFYFDKVPFVRAEVWKKLLERMDDLVIGVINKDETDDNDWDKVMEVVKEGGFHTDNFVIFTESMVKGMYSEYMNWLYATYVSEVKERYPHYYVSQGHGDTGAGPEENFTVYGKGDAGEVSINVKNKGRSVVMFISFVKNYLHNGKKYTISLPNITLDISRFNKKASEQYFSEELLAAVDKLLGMYYGLIDFELLEDEDHPFTFAPSDELTQAHLDLKSLLIRDYELHVDTVELEEYGKVIWSFELEGNTYLSVEQLYWNPQKPYTLEEVDSSDSPEVVGLNNTESDSK